MPNREFIETYPLYRKYNLDTRGLALYQLGKTAIHMYCNKCQSGQTFNMVNDYWAEFSEYRAPNYAGERIARLHYRCSSCDDFHRTFFIRLGDSSMDVMKIGQYPPWDITLNRDLERALGSNTEFYKRGLICESQGYGIGAFAYYRRIVELTIDTLLDQIAGLLSGDDQEKYMMALAETKKTVLTSDKIALVKDLLPPILRPDNTNPLSTLHTVLSEGLHQETDERCLELAATVREVLVFLVAQVNITQSAAKTFTDSMRKLLQRRSD